MDSDKLYHREWTIPCTRCREKTIRVYGDDFAVDVPYDYTIYCEDCTKLIRFLPTVFVTEIPKESESE